MVRVCGLWITRFLYTKKTKIYIFVFYRIRKKYNYCTYLFFQFLIVGTYNTNCTYLFYVSRFFQLKKLGVDFQKAYKVGVYGSNLVKKINQKQIG